MTLGYTSIAEYKREIKSLRGKWKPQDFSKRVMVEEDEILIAADLHVPYHDEQLLAEFFETADIIGSQAIVFLGDLMDNPVWSHWGVDDITTTFKRELGIVEGIVRIAARDGRKVYWSLGNHEQRWMRKVDSQLTMYELALGAHLQDLLDDKQLIVSDNPTLDLGYKWVGIHPEQYGRTPLKVPGEIADLQKRNVISAHAHHAGKGKSPTGDWDVLEAGCMLNPKLIKYYQHGVTNHRPWVQGYVSLSYGTARLFEKGE